MQVRPLLPAPDKKKKNPRENPGFFFTFHSLPPSAGVAKCSANEEGKPAPPDDVGFMPERPVSRNHSVFREAKNCKAPWGFGLPGAQAQKKMDKGQYPLSAKRKCHANIPAANILTLLPTAGARKRGLFIKSPLLTPSKIFRQLTPGIGRVLS